MKPKLLGFGSIKKHSRPEHITLFSKLYIELYSLQKHRLTVGPMSESNSELNNIYFNVQNTTMNQRLNFIGTA